MTYSRLTIISFVVLAAAIALFLWIRETSQIPTTESGLEMLANHQPFKFPKEDDRHEESFRVDWPPKSPVDPRRLKTPPFLVGKLIVSSGRQDETSQLNVRIELTRASEDADRVRWNSNLKFPEYDWMSNVRVWDSDEKWLWPNLPFLLRAYGVERWQRYGGVDPGKGVDNDFAAVVVKSLETNSNGATFVTAEWHSPPVGIVDKHSIVHKAISEDVQWAEFEGTAMNGRLGVWLIYADFLGYAPPASWPDEPEFNGGVLAYATIQWRRNDDGRVEIVDVVNETPPMSTGVDWEQWLESIRRTK